MAKTLVTTSQIEGPSDPSLFTRPKTNHKSGKPYLTTSPQINFKKSKIRKQVKALVEGKETAWAEVESIYDWVRDTIEQQPGSAQDVYDVIRNKKGNGEDKVALFVAMCRANKIPARMVWVEGTQYAEFMLVDQEKNPHWFPCNVSGIREFGSISDPRVIVQKGDNIRVPEKDKRLKFVNEFASCKGKSKPAVRFIRKILPADE